MSVDVLEHRASSDRIASISCVPYDAKIKAKTSGETFSVLANLSRQVWVTAVRTSVI